MITIYIYVYIYILYIYLIYYNIYIYIILYILYMYYIYIYIYIYISEIKNINQHNSQHYSLPSFYFCHPMLEKMRPHSPNSKTWSFDINKKHFYEKKVCRKSELTTSPTTLLNFGKQSKTANACKRLEILKVHRQDALKETMKKLTFAPSHHLWKRS